MTMPSNSTNFSKQFTALQAYRDLGGQRHASQHTITAHEPASPRSREPN